MNDLNSRLNEITNLENKQLYPPFPKKNLLIEVTNACNCNCIFCANSKMKRKRKYINKELVIKILNESFELGTREVGFYTTGEALINNDIAEYIKIAKNIGFIYVYLTTNAILLNETKIEEIVNAGIDSIKISINAINDLDYKFIHGIDTYEKVMNNLKNLYNYRKNKKLKYKIYVSYISTRYTDYDTNKIKNHFSNWCDEIVIVNVRNQSGMMPEIISLLSCYNTSNKIQAERIIPCHYVFNTLNVSCEGYLTACCTDFENYLAYADLNTTSLKDAWHNELITELRKKHLEKKLGNTLCNNCINNSKCIPKPLSKKYIESEIKKEIFEKDNVENRIKKYKNMIIDKNKKEE